MKKSFKSLKKLELKKETITNLNDVKGGCPAHNPPSPNPPGPTNGALFTCPPPGMQCF